MKCIMNIRKLLADRIYNIVKRESMDRGHHNAVPLVWIRNESDLFNSVDFLPVISGVSGVCQ